MEAAAVERIAELGVTAAQAYTFSDPESVPHALVLGGMPVSLEKLRPLRDRFRGAFRTRSLDAFVDYVLTRVKEAKESSDDVGSALPADSKLFIDPEAFVASAFHNIGEPQFPGHCDDQSQLVLVQSPEWKALQGLAGRQVTQRTLADFLTDWRTIAAPLYGDPGLIAEASAEPSKVSAAILSVLNVKVDQAQSTQSKLQAHGAELSAFEALQVKSGDGSALPAGFAFRLKPYEDLAERTVLTVLTMYPPQDNRALTMSLRIVGAEDLAKQMATEFHEVLRARLPDLAAFIGTFDPR
jgi:uncharacterized protein YfdQ (DUF2303 family)